MNKEVIYLEPEDDITDILTKLQQAEQKLVALVPPKKGAILRSAVNMKLVARVAKECEKVVVVVTADPAIIKMSMAARVPIAKTLQSRPVIPTEEQAKAAEASIEVIDEEPGETTLEQFSRDSKKASASAASEFTEGRVSRLEIDEDDLEPASKSSKKPQKPAKEKTPKSTSDNFFVKYKKYFFIAVPAALLLVILLVWAFVFAPAATITVAISSTPSNINQDIRFTTNVDEADPTRGIVLVSEQTLEQKYTADFTANDEADKGKHAEGTVKLSTSFRTNDDGAAGGFSLFILKDTVISTAGGNQYVTTERIDLSWDGEFPCGDTNLRSNGTCIKSATVGIRAVEPGDDYDLPAHYTRWAGFNEPSSTVDFPITISNSEPISGGTTEMVRVVSEDDITKLGNAEIEKHKSEGKKYLYEDVGDKRVAIDGSFKAEVVNVESKPAVGEPVGDDGSATAIVTIKYSVYAVDKADLETYINSSVQLAADQKVYAIGNPYFERYTALDQLAKVKTTIETGPIVTEDSIFEKTAGRKTGEVNSLLRSVNGISSVNIRTSYFWVNRIPENRDKVTITIETEGE